MNFSVAKRPVRHPAHTTTVVRFVCTTCLTPATCRTFETLGNDEGHDIEIQDYGGNWMTVSNVVNNLQRIGFEIRDVQKRYPDRRVRAVGKDGRLIDML
jgi:hypothetical protein